MPQKKSESQHSTSRWVDPELRGSPLYDIFDELGWSWFRALATMAWCSVYFLKVAAISCKPRYSGLRRTFVFRTAFPFSGFFADTVGVVGASGGIFIAFVLSARTWCQRKGLFRLPRTSHLLRLVFGTRNQSLVPRPCLGSCASEPRHALTWPFVSFEARFPVGENLGLYPLSALFFKQLVWLRLAECTNLEFRELLRVVLRDLSYRSLTRARKSLSRCAPWPSMRRELLLQVNRVSFMQGIVVLWCQSCNQKHLIADNLGKLDFPEFGRNVEEFMAKKGTPVKRVVMSRDGLSHVEVAVPGKDYPEINPYLVTQEEAGEPTQEGFDGMSLLPGAHVGGASYLPGLSLSQPFGGAGGAGGEASDRDWEDDADGLDV